MKHIIFITSLAFFQKEALSAGVMDSIADCRPILVLLLCPIMLFVLSFHYRNLRTCMERGNT